MLTLNIEVMVLSCHYVLLDEWYCGILLNMLLLGLETLMFDVFIC